MLLSLLSLLTFAHPPDLEITVEAKQYEEIYVEEPRIISEWTLEGEDYETESFGFQIVVFINDGEDT